MKIFACSSSGRSDTGISAISENPPDYTYPVGPVVRIRLSMR